MRPCVQCCRRSPRSAIVWAASLVRTVSLVWTCGMPLLFSRVAGGQQAPPSSGDEPQQVQEFDLAPLLPPQVEDPPRASAPAGPLLSPPGSDDFTGSSLRRYQRQLELHYDGYLKMPLDVKAEYFDWELWRYHLTADGQAYHRVAFSEERGAPTVAFPARDSSTWNGALLAAMCFKYAAIKDAATLERIADLVRGLHLFFEVTGQPGLMARAVARADGMILDELKPNVYVAPDGTRRHFHGDPAKGGYNQLAIGYAALMMYAHADLPPDVQELARADMHAMVLHMIDHGWQATNRDGSRTTYGDLRPLAGTFSVPFNAQVAYLLVALGYSFPPDDSARRERIFAEFRRLRGTHHVYYEHPWASLAPPQVVGGSPFVKGMNDRNHVTNAAFMGLMLEFDHARRHNEPYNDKFVFQLGQTMVHSMEYLYDRRNSLCAFMWGGLLQDPRVFDVVVNKRREQTRGQRDRALVEGVEQLRHFALDRFEYDGPHIAMDAIQWNDDFQPDDFYWKVNPYLRKPKTGPRRAMAYCAVDYLYAYWLLRYFRLDEHPAVAAANVPALARTPGLK